ncbi:MAG TPA: PRC and DUF2382 domain-containing protein [Anaerolineae bacterium]|nr:PRC and DUF2382 domain-containing protein [Anaerolineae bacterium]
MAFKRFSDLGAEWEVEPEYKDIRGFEAIDKDGNDIGEVQDLLVDTDTNAINYALVGRGWLPSILGEKNIIVPLRKMDIDQEDKSVHLDITREDLRNFPDWSMEDPDLKDKVDAFWGAEPYRRPIAGRERYGRPTTIPVVEERARVEKEREKVGEVAVTKEEEVERKPITEEVKGERVEVEREKVPEKPLAEYEEARKMEPGETISVPVTEERIRVTKEPVVVEEIRLRKVPTKREVTVEEELRKERVEVEEKKGKEPAA